MKYIENVMGSEVASAPLIMNIDTIYVHTNVRKVTPKEGEEDRNEYQYTERQYTYIYICRRKAAVFRPYSAPVWAELTACLAHLTCLTRWLSRHPKKSKKSWLLSTFSNSTPTARQQVTTSCMREQFTKRQ